MTDAVLFDARDDGIAVLTINRPDTRNALSREVREGLFDAWNRFERDLISATDQEMRRYAFVVARTSAAVPP